MSRPRLLALVGALLAAMALSMFAGKVWLPLSAWNSDDPRFLIIAELRALPHTIRARLLYERE